ncbi:MAG: hypothetical protein ACRBF0_18610 [Calditrichia bacterium]
MEIKTKSTLIVIATFLAGMILGAVLLGTAMTYRTKGITAQKVSRSILNTIRPTPEQEEPVREALKAHKKRMSGLMQDMRSDMGIAHDSLMQDLDSVLSVEQKERLQRFEKRMQRFGPRGESFRRKKRGLRRGRYENEKRRSMSEPDSVRKQHNDFPKD